MALFRGINELNLDAKGRMALPSKYRESLVDECEGSLVLTIDTEDRCLLVYPMPAWEKVEAQLAKLPSLNKQARRLQRLLMGHATEVDMDKTGRILVPASLRGFAEIDRKAVLIGQGHKFELWADSVWNAERDEWLQEDLQSDDMPEAMSSLSL